MTARTPTPPDVADRLIDAQLRAFEGSLHRYIRRVRLGWSNPYDPVALYPGQRRTYVRAALNRTESGIARIEREAHRAQRRDT